MAKRVKVGNCRILNFARYHDVLKYGLTMRLITKVKQAPVKHMDEIVAPWKNFTVKNIDRSVE